MERLIELKEDVRSFYLWAEKKYPEKQNQRGLSYLLFQLESTIRDINTTIEKEHHAQNH